VAGSPRNFVGRFKYLEAADAHWPELLAALREQVLPVFLTPPPRTPPPGTFRELAATGENAPTTQALELWAKSNRIGDRWLLDAAVQRLAGWRRGDGLDRWAYRPPELELQAFAVEFGAWLPPLTSWGEFKSITTEKFRQELERYRRAHARAWGHGKKQLDEQAVWTVLWQRGLTPGQIRIKRRAQRPVSEANIQMRVREFAQSIGLKLRSPKSNRSRSNITSTSPTSVI
jgi:hypothetical protein